MLDRVTLAEVEFIEIFRGVPDLPAEFSDGNCGAIAVWTRAGGRFDPAYLARTPVATVAVGGDIVAFANLWCAPGGGELSMGLMRFGKAAPAGTMTYLMAEAMLWGGAAGYARFNLGMAPLAGFEARALAPFWMRAGAFLSRHGEHYYNFQGLRKFKDKFDPEWRPRYLASPGGMALPRILANVAALVSGGMKGVVGR